MSCSLCSAVFDSESDSDCVRVSSEERKKAANFLRGGTTRNDEEALCVCAKCALKVDLVVSMQREVNKNDQEDKEQDEEEPDEGRKVRHEAIKVTKSFCDPTNVMCVCDYYPGPSGGSPRCRSEGRG